MSRVDSTVRYCLLEEHAGCRIGSDGSFWRLRWSSWDRVSGSMDRDGDWRVKIPSGKRNKGKVVKIAVLVLTYFVGPKPPGFECCHRDDDKDNNNVSNLYWGTHRQNMIDCVRNGRRRYCRGEEHHWAKLTAEDVREIRRQWRDEKPRPMKVELAIRFGVSDSTIYGIVTGRTWKSLD
jgi:hypothetical protein